MTDLLHAGRRRAPLLLLILTLCTLLPLAACGGTDGGGSEPGTVGGRTPVGTAEEATTGPEAETPEGDSGAPGADGAAQAGDDYREPADPRPVVAFLGDSLTAGYGLPASQAFPAVLEERLAERGLPFRAVNAGVSGDTSAGGLRRLDWVLSSDPDVLVVELGPNDGLRGLDLDMTEDNLRRIVTRAREAGVRVLLVGMRIPPNYGPDYAGDFQALYPRLAEELDVPLVPFLLEGVGGEAELNQGDGIHPTAEGQRLVAGNVEPLLAPLVRAEWDERGGPPDRPAR